MVSAGHGSEPFYSAGQLLPAPGPKQLGQIGQAADYLNRDANHHTIIAGVANVFGNGPYDLFLFPHHLFPFQGFTEDGAPFYGRPIPLSGDPPRKLGVVIDGPRDVIYGVFGAGKKVRVCSFNREKLVFEDLALSNRLNLTGSVGAGMGSFIDTAGKLHVYYSIGDGANYRYPGAPHHHRPTYIPYDGAGFYRGKIPRRILHHLRFDSPRMNRTEAAYRVSDGPGQFLFSSRRTTIVNLGGDRPPALVTSEKQSLLRYYPLDPSTGKPGPEQFVSNKQHVALRHHVINLSVQAISDPETGLSHLLAGDTGRIWFYPFTGEFTENGSPIYGSAQPVLAEGSPLALGELPVISPGDLDGDGLIDFVAGNDAGELLFVKNIGTTSRPVFDHPAALPVGGRPLDLKPGYRGSIQGPGEAMWGYTCPTLYDWSGDGRPDVILNSSLADFMFLKGIPSDNGPAFSEPKTMYCDGLQLHLAWRSQPAVTDWGMGGPLCLIALDEGNMLRRFWRIDNQNVRRGERLKLHDGREITANYDEAAGQTGRAKLVAHDWDQDGAIDLLIGTSRGLSFPASKVSYLPSHYHPNHKASVLLMRNVGSNQDPVFDYARQLELDGEPIAFGIHSCSAAPVDLGRGVVDLLVGEESGSVRYFPREQISIADLVQGPHPQLRFLTTKEKRNKAAK